MRVRRIGSEVDAEVIGELALRGLVELDPVTGLLFASVYRDFRDLSELEAELDRIRSEPVAAGDPPARFEAAVPSDSRATLADPRAVRTAAAIASEPERG